MLARLAHKRVNSGDGESTATDTPEYGDWRTFPPEGMGLTVRHLQPESCPEPLLQHLQQPPLWGRFPTDQSLWSGNTSLTISAYPRAPAGVSDALWYDIHKTRRKKKRQRDDDNNSAFLYCLYEQTTCLQDFSTPALASSRCTLASIFSVVFEEARGRDSLIRPLPSG